MIDIVTIKFFYPMLFTTIGIIIVVLIFAVKNVLIKFKDNDSENFRFKTHIEEHTDTTTKLSKMHDNVIHIKFGEEHELELDVLEKELKKLQENVKELNTKVDILFNKIIKLEQNEK